MQRQHDLAGAAVGLAGDQWAGEGEGADDGAGVGVADLLQHDIVGPAAVGDAEALVGDGPADIDRGALLGGRGDGDVGDHQVRCWGECDIGGHRNAKIGVGIYKLIRRANRALSNHTRHGGVEIRRAGRGCDDDEIVRPADPVRQRHLGGAGVALPDGEIAEMVVLSKQHLAGTGRRLAEIDGINPFRGIGGADALVLHHPGEVEDLPAGRIGAGGYRGDDVLGVGVGDDVERGGKLAAISGGFAILEDSSSKVGDNEQLVAAVESGRQRYRHAVEI